MDEKNTQVGNNQASDNQLSDNHLSDKPEEKAVMPRERRRYAWFAIFGLVAGIAAWIVSAIDGFAAIVSGIVAIVLSACALGSHRGVVRNTAITVIIGSAVLVVVVAAFIFALAKLT